MSRTIYKTSGDWTAITIRETARGVTVQFDSRIEGERDGLVLFVPSSFCGNLKQDPYKHFGALGEHRGFIFAESVLNAYRSEQWDKRMYGLKHPTVRCLRRGQIVR